MTRYSSNNIQSRYNGSRFFLSTTYPSILEDSSDILYITNETDYLDSLANKFYKDSTLWWIIAIANNIGTGRLNIGGGLQIRIPTRISSILSEFNSLNK